MNVLETAVRIISARVPGPFREAGGLPGERAAMRLDTAARAYLWNRRVRGMGAVMALPLAAPVALLPHTVRRPQWYASAGNVGSVWEAHGDRLRWIEKTADAGLRFVGWADDLPGGPSHTGWYCRVDDDGDRLRGGVWQLPGRKGKARYVHGYAEFESRDRETNPGSAAICVSTVLEVDRTGPDAWHGDGKDSDELRDAVRWADGLAESVAEDQRDYDSAYQAGREAGEADNAALEARKEALELVRELRAERGRERRAWEGEAMRPAICNALRARVAALLETISEKREARDESRGNVWGADREAWAAGFCDESAGGFVRAVRLGYRKASDWAGPADANPCNGEAGA